MATDWDEIKRLAADLQKVQLSSTLQKLSERNCVEIVGLLIQKQLIDVIFTNDGKEYVTSSQLESEILDELYMHGGRVNLVELSKSLNIDLSKIEACIVNVKRDNENIHLHLGQLIDETYTQKIASEINEKLSQTGEITVSDLTVQYDLPSDFLLDHVMEKYLGTIINAKQDSKDNRFFFTKGYISRCKGKLRGALAAITRPTSVSAILAQAGVKERIFHYVLDEICTSGIVTSRAPGAQYIPHIYTKTQVDWIRNIYRRENYLEHDSVMELGISDPKSFIQKQLPNEKLTHLKKCTVGPRIVEQLESELEECIASGKYLDVSTVVPSILTDEDLDQLMQLVLDASKLKSVLRFGSIILTNMFLDEIIKPCHVLIDENVKSSVKSGKYQQYFAEKQIGTNKRDTIDLNDEKVDKREERRKKAASGKAGGGAQGRETKTKSTKKHFRGGKTGGHDSDSDNDNTYIRKSKSDHGLELITLKEIIDILTTSLTEDGLEDLAKQIALHYYPQLNKMALNQAQAVFEASLQNNNQSRRQTHAALQEKLNVFIGDIRLYEKGLKLVPADLQIQLIKYLFKTLGTDICNEISFYVANECNLNYTDPQMTIEQRNKLIQECGPDYKAALIALNKALSGSSIDDFLLAAENALQACSMILKKIDKKKDRIVIHSHKLGLLDQLALCNDPATVLHLAVLIIFTTATQNMVHASGRHVSALLSFLKPSIAEEQVKILLEHHDLVIKTLATDSENEEIKELQIKLHDKIPEIREIAKNYKKSGAQHAE